MANGKPGDHPLTDILVHWSPVFLTEVDEMIREIDKRGGHHEILGKIAWLEAVPVDFEN